MKTSKRHSLTARVTPELRERVEAAAKSSGRSIALEIEQRLERSFLPDVFAKMQAARRQHKTFATRKAAEQWSVTALHEVKQGTHTPASVSITVSEGFDLWIADCEVNGLEFGTIKQRKEHKNLHVAPFIGSDKLSALTA